MRCIFALFAKSDMSVEEICLLFAAPDRPLVQELLAQLVARRMIVPCGDALVSDGGSESNLDIFYWQFGKPTQAANETFNSKRIVILGVNRISSRMAAALCASGIDNCLVVDYPVLRNLTLFDKEGKVLRNQWDSSLIWPIGYREWLEKADLQSLDCLVVTCDFGGSPVIREWNKFCVKHQKILLPVLLRNFVGYVGPVIIPGETACYECVHARQNAHVEDLEIQGAVDDACFEGRRVAGFHPSMASILADIAVMELNKFHSGFLPCLKIGTLIEVNLLASKMVTRKILKVPRCVVCSPLNIRSSVAVKKSAFIPVGRMTHD